jgi:hypothetical protein
MGVLSDFFIADEGSFLNYDGGQDFPADDRCQLRSITPLEAAGILSVLRGSGDRIEMIGEFPFLTPEDAEEWKMSVPADMVDALARLDEARLPEVAAACSQLTNEELGWSNNDFQMVLSHLKSLARRAVETNRAMYLWVSL